MGEFFYCVDGVTVSGPIGESALLQLLTNKTISEETSVIRSGEKDWRVAKDYLSTLRVAPIHAPAPPPTTPEAAVVIDVQAIKKADGEVETQTRDKKIASEPEADSVTKGEMLRAIRTDLKLLWETQLESIMSRVRNVPLDKEYETTRKQAKDIYERIEKTCIAYWQKSGVLEDWIDSLIWRNEDFTADLKRKLKGETAIERLEDASKWLRQAGLSEEAGCYCFLSGKEYLYIGQGKSLGNRLADRVHFGDATHLRILIPKNKRWLNKLERLLILNYEPRLNERPGALGNNPVDDTLEFIRNEIRELVTDV